MMTDSGLSSGDELFVLAMLGFILINGLPRACSTYGLALVLPLLFGFVEFSKMVRLINMCECQEEINNTLLKLIYPMICFLGGVILTSCSVVFTIEASRSSLTSMTGAENSEIYLWIIGAGSTAMFLLAGYLRRRMFYSYYLESSDETEVA